MVRVRHHILSVLLLCLATLIGITACKKQTATFSDDIRKAAKELIGVEPEAVILLNWKTLRSNTLTRKYFNEYKSMFGKKSFPGFLKGKCRKLIGIDKFDATAIIVFVRPGVGYVGVRGSFDAKKAIACEYKGKKPAAIINGIPIYKSFTGEFVFAASNNRLVAVFKTPVLKTYLLGVSPMALSGSTGFLQKLQPGKSALGKGMFEVVSGQFLSFHVNGLSGIKLRKIPMIKRQLRLHSIWGHLSVGDQVVMQTNVKMGKASAAKELLTLYKKAGPKVASPHMAAFAKSWKVTRKGALLISSFSHSLKDIVAIGEKARASILHRSTQREAKAGLQIMGDAASAYFAAKRLSAGGKPMPKQFPSDSAHGTTAVQSFTLPKAQPCADGKTPLYPTNATAWRNEPWKSLRFYPSRSHFYQYTYKRGGSGNKAWFELIAKADPGCTGKLIILRVKGSVSALTGRVLRSRVLRSKGK